MEQYEQHSLEVQVMTVRFLGGDTGNDGSPRLYEDGEDFLVQGYLIEDASVLAQLKIPEGETVVRIPKGLMKYLPEEVNGATVP
ncbi:hypothetical protein [Streptosporangium sp. NPDC006007]|uniref:hypothetical protein n=1 Tax=Streptosporangium sp. NPDC006007 TaxID=3154575 RepID=UPI0033BAD90C